MLRNSEELVNEWLWKEKTRKKEDGRKKKKGMKGMKIIWPNQYETRYRKTFS